MSYCVFCAGQDDVHDRKIYNACDILGGTACVPCTQYMEIEAQVEKTQQILKDQLVRQREIRQNINRPHDPMLRRVPREITIQIFELAARVDVTSEGTDSLRDGEIYAPLPLGQICGAWRDIAWGIPQFWTFMSVRFRTTEQLASRFDMAKQWLVRSGDYLPLSIHFRIDQPNKDMDKFLPFINLLNGYSHRWKDLCAHCPDELFLHLTANSLGVPILQNLQLSLPCRTELQRIFGVGDDSPPKPRSLRLHNMVLTPEFRVDWGHINQLKLNCFFSPRLCKLLPLLQNLRDLRILGVIDGTWSSDTPIFVHRKLETLYVDCPDDDQEVEEISKLLNHLTFPSLQHLTINLLHDLELLTAVTSLIQRSSCNLSSLSLDSIPLEPDNMITNLLGHLNSLKILEITTTSWNDPGLLPALSHSLLSGTGWNPLPNLRRFTYNTTLQVRSIRWRLLLGIFDRDWCANRPQWRILSIVRRVPESAKEERKFRFDDVDEVVIYWLVGLVKAGIKVILPEGLDEVIRANVDYMSDEI